MKFWRIYAPRAGFLLRRDLLISFRISCWVQSKPLSGRYHSNLTNRVAPASQIDPCDSIGKLGLSTWREEHRASFRHQNANSRDVLNGTSRSHTGIQCPIPDMSTSCPGCVLYVYTDLFISNSFGHCQQGHFQLSTCILLDKENVTSIKLGMQPKHMLEKPVHSKLFFLVSLNVPAAYVSSGSNTAGNFWPVFSELVSILKPTRAVNCHLQDIG